MLRIAHCSPHPTDPPPHRTAPHTPTAPPHRTVGVVLHGVGLGAQVLHHLGRQRGEEPALLRVVCGAAQPRQQKEQGQGGSAPCTPVSNSSAGSGSSTGGNSPRVAIPPPVRKRGEGRFSASNLDRTLWLPEAMMAIVSKPRQVPCTCMCVGRVGGCNRGCIYGATPVPPGQQRKRQLGMQEKLPLAPPRSLMLTALL